MGAKGKNFYNALVRRYGWEDEAATIQELYLSGNPKAAIAAVPDELVDAVAQHLGIAGRRMRASTIHARAATTAAATAEAAASTATMSAAHLDGHPFTGVFRRRRCRRAHQRQRFCALM